MHTALRLLFSALIGTTLVVPTVHGVERTWTKDHQVIGQVNETTAEFTYIRSDPALPSKVPRTEIPFFQRWLYKGGNDLLVIRSEMTDLEGSHVMTINHLGTGEILTIEIVAEISTTISYGTEQFMSSYPENLAYFEQYGDYIPSTKAEASALFANVSQEFRDALHLLAAVGSYSSHVFSGLTITLNVFFDDVDFELPVEDETGDRTDRIEGFDPNWHSPGNFDLQFGDAYYQCCPGR